MKGREHTGFILGGNETLVVAFSLRSYATHFPLEKVMLAVVRRTGCCWWPHIKGQKTAPKLMKQFR